MAGKHCYRGFAALREILDRGRRARPPAAPAPRYSVMIADGPTGVADRVTEEAFVAGHRAGSPYVALCGAPVLPVSFTTPARFHCPACERGV
jgi:hypothetical protein